MNTGWTLRDAFLKSEDMLDAERFPALRFHSTRLAFDATGLIGVDGEITLRGVTRPVRLEVKRVQCGAIPDHGREGCGASVTAAFRGAPSAWISPTLWSATTSSWISA